MSEISEYREIIVESFKTLETSGRHGQIHIRPIKDQYPFLQNMFVECAKKLIKDFSLGTRFKITAKITNRLGGTQFIYSHYKWPFSVLK